MQNELPAGRELDALVATKVMGWSWDEYSAQDANGSKYHRCQPACSWDKDRLWFLPHYSTSIEAAWTVVQKLLPRIITLRWCDGWEVNEYLPDEKETVLLGEAKEAPLAICRSALAAVDVMEEEK